MKGALILTQVGYLAKPYSTILNEEEVCMYYHIVDFVDLPHELIIKRYMPAVVYPPLGWQARNADCGYWG